MCYMQGNSSQLLLMLHASQITTHVENVFIYNKANKYVELCFAVVKLQVFFFFWGYIMYFG